MCEGEDDCTICSSYVFQAVSNTEFAGVLSTDLIQILSHNLTRQTIVICGKSIDRL